MPHQSQAAQCRDTTLASAITDADPHRLVALLLSGACDRIRFAEVCMGHGDQARKGKAIGEVCAILGHLDGSLDHEAGGAIAGSLSSLYDYLQGRMIDANLNNDAAALQEALSLLGEIEAAWDAIPHEQRHRPVSTAVA